MIMQWYLIVVCNLCFPINRRSWHLCIFFGCLGFLFFWKTCSMFKLFIYFSIGYSDFICRSILCILDTIPLAVYILQIYPLLSCALSFHSSNAVFWWTGTLNFDGSTTPQLLSFMASPFFCLEGVLPYPEDHECTFLYIVTYFSFVFHVRFLMYLDLIF